MTRKSLARRTRDRAEKRKHEMQALQRKQTSKRVATQIGWEAARTRSIAFHKYNMALMHLINVLNMLTAVVIGLPRLPESQRAEQLKVQLGRITASSVSADMDALRWTIQDYGEITDAIDAGAINSVFMIARGLSDGLHVFEESGDTGALIRFLHENGPDSVRDMLETAERNPINVGRPDDPVTEAMRALVATYRPAYTTAHTKLGHALRRDLLDKERAGTLTEAERPMLDQVRHLQDRQLGEYIRGLDRPDRRR